MKPEKTKFEFTEASIARLKFAPKGKRYRVWDAGTKNLALRIGEKSKVYYLMKNLNGRITESKLGDAAHMSVKDAREAIIENMPDVNKGINPTDKKRKIRKDVTIKEFFDKTYFPRHCELFTKPLSQRNNLTLMRIQFAPLYNKKMLSLTSADIEIWHKTIGRKSKYRANRALALMRHMYNKAIRWVEGIENNPTKGIEMFPEESRDRFLRPEELPRLYNALDKPENDVIRNYVLLSLYCGQRRGNMLAISWDDVDFDHKVIYIADTKNNEPQTVPLADQAIELLEEMRAKAKSKWLFPSNRNTGCHFVDLRGSWNKLLNDARIENFRLHDLRRTFGSYQAQRDGANPMAIQRALGDKSRAAADVYMRMGLDPVRRSIQGAVDDMVAFAKSVKKDKE